MDWFAQTQHAGFVLGPEYVEAQAFQATQFGAGPFAQQEFAMRMQAEAIRVQQERIRMSEAWRYSTVADPLQDSFAFTSSRTTPRPRPVTSAEPRASTVAPAGLADILMARPGPRPAAAPNGPQTLLEEFDAMVSGVSAAVDTSNGSSPAPSSSSSSWETFCHALLVMMGVGIAFFGVMALLAVAGVTQ